MKAYCEDESDRSTATKQFKEGDFNTPNITMLINKSLHGHDPLAFEERDTSKDIDVKVDKMGEKVQNIGHLSRNLIGNANHNMK